MDMFILSKPKGHRMVDIIKTTFIPTRDADRLAEHGIYLGYMPV
jgi:hypothetical protein